MEYKVCDLSIYTSTQCEKIITDLSKEGWSPVLYLGKSRILLQKQPTLYEWMDAITGTQVNIQNTINNQ